MGLSTLRVVESDDVKGNKADIRATLLNDGQIMMARIGQ